MFAAVDHQEIVDRVVEALECEGTEVILGKGRQAARIRGEVRDRSRQTAISRTGLEHRAGACQSTHPLIRPLSSNGPNCLWRWHLSPPLLESLRSASPLLLALGTVNTVVSSLQGNLGGDSTALCLCVRVVGLFVEDKGQQDLLIGQWILVRVAVRSEATAVQVACLSAAQRVWSRSASNV